MYLAEIVTFWMRWCSSYVLLPVCHSCCVLLHQAEIVDETDVYEDVERQVLRQRGQRADVAHYLAMFEHKLHQSVMLSSGEMQAAIAFLSQREEFSQLARFPLAFQVRAGMQPNYPYMGITAWTIDRD